MAFWRSRRKAERPWRGPTWSDQMWSDKLDGPVVPITYVQLNWPNWFQRMGRWMIEIFKPNVSWTPHEALYCLLAAAAWADGKVQTEEDKEIQALAGRTPTLSKVPPGDIKAINSRIVRRLNDDFQGSVERACASLPANMRRAAFCHAVDIVYADRAVLPEEARYLNKLVELLQIHEPEARTIAGVFEAKNAF
jgi:uncharacterized tellurite resistance protein B-like protein